MDFIQPTAADFALSDAQRATDRVAMLEERVRFLEQDQQRIIQTLQQYISTIGDALTTSPSLNDRSPWLKISATIPEAIAMTGLSRSSLYKAISEHKLTPRKNGKRTFLLVEDLKRFIGALPA